MEIVIGVAVIFSGLANVVAVLVLVRSINQSQSVWRDVFAETLKQYQRDSSKIARQVDELWRGAQGWQLALHGIEETLREIRKHQEGNE